MLYRVKQLIANELAAYKLLTGITSAARSTRKLNGDYSNLPYREFNENH